MSGTDTLSESNPLLVRSFRWVALPLLLVLLGCIGYLPMTWQQQAFFGVLMVIAAMIISRTHSGRAGTLVLMMFSMCATARYAVWRVGSLVHYFTSPWQAVDGWNALFMLLLICAELYSFLILYLGYMQTIAPLRRPPVTLPVHSEEWPSIDVMIPTYNEPMEVVRYTVLAAKQLDWPTDKLNIWLLDDGERAAFRDFATEAQIHYIARPEHTHAKAGNINYALDRTSGDLVAIFDCDHVPTRSFLQVTAGWFLRDTKLAMLQTPHHFYSPDPFERNLGHFRSVPNEGELFYGIIQDTNDLWNATFFCGSCAVLRRSALKEVGGIAHETVTEDAHTSLRLQKLGWNTAYINLAQAGGLATETLGDHVKQRVRWARGMAQILRIDNPLFARGLDLPQRLCYLNAMLHFLYALPRLVFLSAPILYLVFGKLNIPGYWLTILVFATPHLVLSMLTNSRVQGMKRYSFWNEIYETVLSPYILLPTLFALVSPKFGKFNVTAKGQNTQEDYFDSKLARPFLALLAMNLLGLVMAVPRYLYWDRGHTGTIVMNVVWTLFNLTVLGVTLSICWESKQRRQAVRVTTRVPIEIKSHSGISSGILENLSVSGASAMVGGSWQAGEALQVSFPTEDPHAVFSASVVASGQGRLRLFFNIANIEQQEAITRVLYLGADRWLDWTDGRRSDNILKSLFAVFAASAAGFRQSLRLTRRAAPAARTHTPGQSGKQAGKLVGKAAALLLVAGGLFLFLRSAHGESPRALPVQKDAAYVSVDLPLRSIGARDGVLLDRYNRNQGLTIALPNDVLMSRGVLHLKYSLPESRDETSTLEVLLNDTMLAAITPDATELAVRHGEATIPLPVELLVRQNRLTLRLADAGGAGCSASQSAAQSSTAPILIDADTSLSLEEQRLVLANDLGLLPEPFVQRIATQTSTLPVVFARQPSLATLQAAGVLVSWFGSQTQEGQTSYPVSLGALPMGNAVVLLLAEENLPGLQTARPARAGIATMANPADPYGKLLILTAATPADLLALTQSLALGQLPLSGESASLRGLLLPGRRLPDDAPRWIHTRRVSLEALNGGNPLRTIDSNPLNLYMRLAPDYNYGPDRDMYVHLDYGNDAAALGSRSNLLIRLNGSPTDSVPVRAGQGLAGRRPSTQQANLALGVLPASVFANTLQAQFYFVPPTGQECNPMHYGGSLGSGSYIDLGKAAHLAQLPNLHLFSNAGFPFTRMADLAETAVLLPDNPAPGELTLYLDLLGYFGAQTGYPALRVEVASARDAAGAGSQASDRFKNKDLLVLGTYADMAGLPALNDSLPLQLHDGAWQLSRAARMVETLRGWEHTVLGREQKPSTDDDLLAAGVLEQGQSPFSADHSLVLVLAQNAAALEPMAAGLMAELPHDGIAGSVSLWQSGNFVSHNYSTHRYYIGDVGPLTRIKLILPDHPVALLGGLILLFTLMALWLNAWLDHRIRQRLMGVAFDLDGNANLPARF